MWLGESSDRRLLCVVPSPLKDFFDAARCAACFFFRLASSFLAAALLGSRFKHRLTSSAASSNAPSLPRAWPRRNSAFTLDGSIAAAFVAAWWCRSVG